MIRRCSLVFGASIMQDRDLSQYNPSLSSTSKHLSCSNQLCQLGPNCKNPKEHCPYNVDYYSENTSSSGFLFQDQLHLVSVDGLANKSLLHASVIVGYVRLVCIFIMMHFSVGKYIDHLLLLTAVVANKVAVTWMDLLLMGLWDWDQGKFLYLVCLQNLVWFRIHFHFVSTTAIPGEFTLGTKGLEFNEVLPFCLMKGNSKYYHGSCLLFLNFLLYDLTSLLLY